MQENNGNAEKKIIYLFFWSDIWFISRESEKWRSSCPHSQRTPHFVGSYHKSLKNKLRIAGALHNMCIEGVICAYKDRICFLLCTQILQWKMSGHWIIKFN